MVDIKNSSPAVQTSSVENPGARTPPGKRRRSPVERAIVWTSILIFMVIVAWQWYCRDSFNRSLTALDAEVDAMRTSIDKEKAEFERDAQEKGIEVTGPEIYTAVRERMKFRKASEVPQFIYGFPSLEVTSQMTPAGPMRREIYAWRGLFKSYYLYLKYELGDDPRLVNVDSTFEQPTPD
jgi:hypothetical protein